MNRLIKRGITATALVCAISNAAVSAELDSTDLQNLRNRLERQEAMLQQQQRLLDAQAQELKLIKKRLQNGMAYTSASGDDSSLHEYAISGQGPTQVQIATTPAEPIKENGLEFSGYGIVNYYDRDWDTDKFAKNSFDTERFILEMEYRYNDKWSAKAELEFEHGGTGATLELDTQEEFGEFEQEIEKGGEVLVEELFIAYHHADWLNARFGRFYVPVGRTNKYHKPQDYFTVARSYADGVMVPMLWHENGLSVYGSFSLGNWGQFKYETQLVNGLDSTGFSSRNWIAPGHQKRFEQAIGEDLAFVARGDYLPMDNMQIAVAYYGGNTNANRPKNDLKEDAYVDLWEFDGEWRPGNAILRGQYMWGRLQNSHLVSNANRNLSNNLGVKRTPVGSEAQSWYVEAGYDLLGASDQDLILFARYDEFDSMFKTEGLVYNNPRWEQTSWTVGVNYLPIPNIILKAEYNERELNLDELNMEKTFALGVGFTY